MRAIITAAILALLFVASSAASVGLAPDDRGNRDDCSSNNADTPFSCFTIGSEDSPKMYYLDTGRADGWSGLWEESNTWDGLQKTRFHYSGELVSHDLDLLS